MTTKPQKVYYLCAAAVFAAFIGICSQIQIPLPMIPINLALFAVNLAGVLLGAKYGTLSVIVYVLLGLVGVPVFSNFSGGAGVLFGKTGGYIIGYIFAAFITGLLAKRFKSSPVKLYLVMTLATLTCYAFGTVWFMVINHSTLWATLGACVFPFIPGDIIKMLAVVLLSRKLKKPLSKYLPK